MEKHNVEAIGEYNREVNKVQQARAFSEVGRWAMGMLALSNSERVDKWMQHRNLLNQLIISIWTIEKLVSSITEASNNA